MSGRRLPLERNAKSEICESESTGQIRWRSRSSTQIFSVLLGVFPFVGFIVWSHLTRGAAYSLAQLILFPLVLGSLGVAWIGLLQTTFCGKRLSDFNIRTGTWRGDLLRGVGLTLALVAWMFVLELTVSRWLARSPSPDVRNLIAGLAEDPWLLALWLGPVVWIGVAAFEELSRVFLLQRLWSVWPHAVGR